jgi:hypothetical protein
MGCLVLDEEYYFVGATLSPHDVVYGVIAGSSMILRVQRCED